MIKPIDDISDWAFENPDGSEITEGDIKKHVSNLPPEPAEADYSQLPPTPGEAVKAFRDTGPATVLDQAVAKGHYSDAEPWDRYANTLTVGRKQDQELGLPPEGQMLDPVEANARYAPKGEDWFSKPISEGLAQVTAKQKLENLQRDSDLARYENYHSWPVTFGMSAVGFMLDPANLAATFVPGIGEEAVAARLGGGVVGRIAGRATAGAIGGAAASVPSVVAHTALDDQYSLRDAFLDLAMGAAGGAVIQGGVEGALREGWRAAVGTKASAIHTAISSAISQTVEEKPVDVTPILHPPPSDIQVHNVRLYLMATGQKADEETIVRAAAIAGRGEDIDFALNEARKEALPQTLAQVAEKQKTLNDVGYASGMSTQEFLNAKESVDAAASAKPPEPEPPKLEPTAGGEARAPTGEPTPQAEVKPGEILGPAAVRYNDEVFTGVEHLDALDRLLEAKGKDSTDEIDNSDNLDFGQINEKGEFVPHTGEVNTKGLSLAERYELSRIKESPNAKHLAPEEVDRIIALPEVQAAIKAPRQIDRTHDVPYLAGSNNEGGVTYIDRRVPPLVAGIDPAGPLNVHEQVEHALMTKGNMPYESAHRVALVEEQKAVEALGGNWAQYQSEMSKLVGTTEHESAKAPPPDLYLKPYPHSEAEFLKHEGAVGTPETPAIEASAEPLDPEIAEAQGLMVTAQLQEQALAQAAQCLVEAGI